MIITRPAIAADREFIVSGWSSSYRNSRDCTTPMSLYAAKQHAEVEYYMDRCRVLVGHGELGVLFGFIAYDPSTYVVMCGRRPMTLAGYVLYVYVAAPFRRRGFARQLFKAAGINPTQRFGYLYRTRWSWDLRSKIPLAEHEPNRARYEETHNGRRSDEAAESRDHEAGRPEGAGADPGNEDQAR